MPRLVETLGLKGNPFEHYVAETEPDIAEYAVKPPYFEAIDARALTTSSYVLFGDRGSGKSATRLTIFKQLWGKKANDQRVPLVVNFTDFTSVLHGKEFVHHSEGTLVKEVAFVVIESLLAWLSALEEDEREVYLEGLNDDENALSYQMLRDYYLSRPEAKRDRSVREAMLLFNQAFLAKSRLWVERRWDPISRLIGTITDALSRRYVDTHADVGGAVTKALARAQGDDFDSILLLRRLVDLARIFAFSGIVVLIDKVDETDATSNSADRSAALIHPLLARVQLLEIEGLSWIFFLWHKVKSFFEDTKYHVRLDKIGHALVSWDDEFFALMLNKRADFFSDSRLDFSGLFAPEVDMERVYTDLVTISMRSPRELIRLMDVIIREHDIRHAPSTETRLLDPESIDAGLDKYVTDVITTAYGERLLAQIFRLNRTVFTNKDVQNTFRVGAQSARTRIQSWENAGIIKLTGTRAAEGTQGGKPANEYTIVDTRIERIMTHRLVSYAPDQPGPDLQSEDEEGLDHREGSEEVARVNA
jgi:hypothetical protein